MRLKKFIRFLTIYSLSRTIIKVVGRLRDVRLRILFPRLLISRRTTRDTSLIGCGQFGFSTISFYLYRSGKNHFLHCYDTDENAGNSTAKFWGYKVMPAQELIASNACKLVYIASNHASHTSYAIQAIEQGKDVYIEKPVSVNRQQLEDLCSATRSSNSNLYVGYNRPFSKAIDDLRPYLEDNGLAISLSCFISGHLIGPDHWYRRPEEGTRVCGNMGHWIDLSIFLMAIRGRIPEQFDITATYSSQDQRDDNVVINYGTSAGDIVSICLTARSEPFEGINESINLQSGATIAKIDDFRHAKIWDGVKFKKRRYWPKDVGHKKAVLQPFAKEKRDFSEVLISSLLMLEIKNMVETGATTCTYKPFQDPIYKNYKQ